MILYELLQTEHLFDLIRPPPGYLRQLPGLKSLGEDIASPFHELFPDPEDLKDGYEKEDPGSQDRDLYVGIIVRWQKRVAPAR